MKKAIAVLLIVVVGLPVLWILVASMLATRQEQAADRGWTELGLSMDGFAARFPKQDASPAALEIEASAANMGIPMAPTGAPGRPQPSPAASKAFDALPLATFVDAQMERGDSAVDVPPVELTRFLTAHAADIAAIQAASTRQVTWEQDVQRLFSAPLPSLKGQRALHSVLVLDALERLGRGDSPGALNTLGSAWRINAALRSRPELITQLIAVALDRLILGAVRRVPAPTEEWRARVREHDYRKSMLTAFQTEGWLLSQFTRSSDPAALTVITGGTVDAPRTALERYVYGPLARPYLRLAAANHSDVLRQAVADLKTKDACALDSAAFEQSTIARIPRWNILSKIAVPSLSRAWLAAARVEMEAELTQKTIEARLARAGSPEGAWPAALAKAPSEVCPGVTWRYEVAAGSATFFVDADPFNGGEKGLPLRFVASDAAPRPQ
jgi:hypothetical protein